MPDVNAINFRVMVCFLKSCTYSNSTHVQINNAQALLSNEVEKLGASEMAFEHTAPESRLTKRVIVEFFAIGFVVTITNFLITPFLSIYFISKLQLSTPTASALLGWSGVLNYAWSILAGRITDRSESAWSAKTGLFLACALQVGLLLHATVTWMFIVLVISGLGRSLFVNVITNKIYRSFSTSVSNEANSWFQAGVNASAFLCPLIVGLVGLDHMRDVALASLVLDLTVALIFGVYLKTPKKTKSAVAHGRKEKSVNHWVLYALLIVGVLYAFAYKQYFTTLSLLFFQQTLCGLSLYSVLVALEGIGGVVMQPIYIRCARILAPPCLLLIGAISYSLGFITLWVFGSGVSAALCFALLFAFGSLFIGASLSTLVFSSAPVGATASWLGLLNATRMASGLGIVAGGTMLAHRGPMALLGELVVVGIMLLVFVGFVCAAANRKTFEKTG